MPAVPDGQKLCVAFVDTKGTIESRACPDVKAGDCVKVVLSGFLEPNLRYSLVVGNQAYRSTILNHFDRMNGPTTQSHSGLRVRPGHFLIKKSDSNSVSGTDSPLGDGEVGLALVFQTEAQPIARGREAIPFAQIQEAMPSAGKISPPPSRQNGQKPGL